MDINVNCLASKAAFEAIHSSSPKQSQELSEPQTPQIGQQSQTLQLILTPHKVLEVPY